MLLFVLWQFVRWHVLSNISRQLFISTFQPLFILVFPAVPPSLLVQRQLFSNSLKISTIITIKRCWHDIKKFVHANKHNIICLWINARMKRQGILCDADVSSLEDDDVWGDNNSVVLRADDFTGSKNVLSSQLFFKRRKLDTAKMLKIET